MPPGRGALSVDWEDLVKVFLHDPPDKALGVQRHEQRATRYLEAALGSQVSRRQLKRLAGMPDQLAAIAERLPMPSAGEQGERAVNASPNGRLIVRHPLSADELEIFGSINEVATATVVRDVVDGMTDPRQQFVALWRLLPERLAWSLRLPAETRVPDHTLWHHADVAAGLYATHSESEGSAFLSFSIGPVQPFVAAARSVRDLWTGSAILSWLTFQAMQPIIEELGPTALVFPALRGAPLMDLWLSKELPAREQLKPNADALKAPSIPNRFLAMVPWGREGEAGRAIAARCDESVRQAWRRLADAVKQKLDPLLQQLFPDWAARWDAQIENYFEVLTAVLPTSICDDDALARLLGKSTFAKAWPDAGAVRALNDCMPADHRPSYEQKDAGRWQAQVEFAGRLLAAARAVRHVPPSTAASAAGQYPNKCTLFGSFEQMGPDNLKASRQFWEKAAANVVIEGVRLGKRDRFCAVALAKRFAAPAFLAKELGLEQDSLRIPDTWTVAAALWLKRAGIDWTHFENRNGQRWNGQWLHWRGQHDDADEDRVPDDTWTALESARKRVTQKPPVYYAILKMDADEIGAWLRGEKAPRLREILHPDTRAYFEGLPDREAVRTALDARRPVGPALHAAISEALANFAVHVVPHLVAKHCGTVIYAGGDDVLALLPVETALYCAWELRQAFSGLPPVNGSADPGYWCRLDGRELLMMGPRASLSAGIAVLHAKDDLREGLEAARQAEKAAKAGGRDALVVTVQRRSGERTFALAAWPTVQWLDEMREAFASGASDRWAYRLREEEPTLGALPFPAVLAEVRRQVDRSEAPTRRLLGGGDEGRAGTRIADALSAYEQMCRERNEASTKPGLLADFLTLCQSASFLARGRD